MPKTAKTITESEAALQDAQREHLRISNALAECDAELVRLDLHNHVQAATASLDAAVDAGDTASIQAAAQALQAAKVESDAVGATRLATQARARTLRAALAHAETAMSAAKRQVLRDRDERLCEQLDAEWTHYQKMLDPLITAHLRLAFLSNEIWKVRAEIVGARQINYTAPQSHFSLPCPNGSMPHLPVNARADKMLSRTVDITPPRVVIHGTPAMPWTDRDLVEQVQKSIEEV